MEKKKSEKEACCTHSQHIVTYADLPLACPPLNERVWDGHPRVYLPIAAVGKVLCPYCGCEYSLKVFTAPKDSLLDHFQRAIISCYGASYFVIGPSWVGDMVMAQCLFKLLKQRPHPVIIDVLAPTWTLAVLSRMPEVSQAIESSLAHGELGLSTRYQIGKQLRKRGYARQVHFTQFI